MPRSAPTCSSGTGSAPPVRCASSTRRSAANSAAGRDAQQRGGDALAAGHATIGSELIFKHLQVTGGVSLFRASARTLVDDVSADRPLGSWEGIDPLVLDGFGYSRFGGKAEWGSTLRTQWLKETAGFQQGAWQQLIEVYRAQGRDDDATNAAIAMHNDRVKRAGLPPYRRWGRQVLRVVIGHGYRPWLAGVWAAGIIAAFALVVWQGSGMFVPEAQGLTGSPQPVAYAADTFLPIVDSRRGQGVEADRLGSLGGLERDPARLGATTIFVAGFTRIVRSWSAASAGTGPPRELSDPSSKRGRVESRFAQLEPLIHSSNHCLPAHSMRGYGPLSPSQ